MSGGSLADMDEYQNGVIGIYYLEKGNRLAENGDGFQGETDQGEKQFGSFIWKTSSRRSGVTAAGGYVLGQIATEFPHTSNNSSFCGCQRRISFHMPVIPPNTSNIHHYHRSFTNFWAARYQTSHLWPKQRSKFAEPAFTGNTHCRGKLFQLRGAVCFFWQETAFYRAWVCSLPARELYRGWVYIKFLV